MQKNRWLGWGIGLLVFGVALGLAAWGWQQVRAPAAQYRSVVLERGNLQATVTASGTVTPVSLVTVGTQVSGQIQDVLVDFNTEVQSGQLLALIDPQTFEVRLRSAQADVDAAHAQVATAQANALAAAAQVARVQIDMDEAQRDAARKQSLLAQQFISQSELDRALALGGSTAQALKAVQAQVAVAQAQVQSALANVAQRQALLAQARIDLARTRITSPVAGIVIKRAIERGQTVASSLQSPELFVIARNLADMQVEAVIDESDVGRLQPGQTTRFTVDAFPGQTFEGKIAQLRKAPSNVANVVTYVAIVRFSNSKRQLLPGMTANVRVVTDTRENVWTVPNAALRVRIAQADLPNAAPKGQPKPAASSAPTDKPSGTRGRIYVLDRQGQPQPVAVRLGVTDGRQTELLEVDEPRTAAWLQPGVQVVTQVQASADSGHAAGGAKPASAAPRLAW